MAPRSILFLGNSLFAIFSTLTSYILLPYLTAYMPVAYAGLLIAVGALGALVLFPLMPRLAARYGAARLAASFSLLETIALILLAASPGAVVGSLLITLSFCLQPLLAYQLDVLLEATVFEEGTTGRVRALFISAWNVAALGTPLLLGALLVDSDAYGRIFLASAAIMAPLVVLFSARRLPQNPFFKSTHIKDTLVCMTRDRDLTMVTLGHFLLYCFFVWAPLYLPVYLHTVLHIPWADLGWMFFLMLIPYALLEYPTGWVADRYLGDKELMVAGFLIMGGAFASVSLLTPATPLLLIALILVLTRVGAALVESTNEGHFFRRVSERDVNSISVFRGVWPAADLFAPLVGSALLFFGSFELLFTFTGGFLAVLGAFSALRITDFR